MPLKCMDFVGYVRLNGEGETSKLIFKAVYKRADPEVNKLTIRVYIEGSLLLDKTYDVTQDTMEIKEEISVAWQWGVASCPLFVSERLSMPRAPYVVIAARGSLNSTIANTLEGNCVALVPETGNIEAMIVSYDKPLYITGNPAYAFNCGSMLEEGVAKATVVVKECRDSDVCVEWSQSLLLYAVKPAAVASSAKLLSVTVSQV